jgi:hypothetical protein
MAEVIARCSAGHLFTSTWVPLGSLKAVRLGRKRYQRCPVGRHWTMIERVDPATLTTAELAEAARYHDLRIP